MKSSGSSWSRTLWTSTFTPSSTVIRASASSTTCAMVDLAVPARLIDHGGAELAGQLRVAAALGVDPHLDHVAALGGDLVHLGARLLRRLRLRARFERLRHEAVHHGQDARAAQVARLLPRLELAARRPGRNTCWSSWSRRRAHIGAAAGSRGGGPTWPCPLMIPGTTNLPVRSTTVAFGGSRQRGRGRDVADAAILHHDRDVALRRCAGSVDQRGVGQDGDLGRRVPGEQDRGSEEGQRICAHAMAPVRVGGSEVLLICAASLRRGNGAPDRIRTCDLCLRRAALYPAELRALGST